MSQVDEPQGSDCDTQYQMIQALLIRDLAGFQVKTVAFPITKGGLNPEPLAPTPPTAPIGGSVTDHIAGCVPVVCPIGHQVDVRKGLAFGQRDPMQVAPLSTLDRNRVQRLPVVIIVLEQSIGLHADLPAPMPLSKVPLQADGAELAVAEEHDTLVQRKKRFDVLQQLSLERFAG